jgi:CheY-like chemotaxis protein
LPTCAVTVPIIAMTASVSVDDAEKFTDAIMNMHLNTPIDSAAVSHVQ